MAANKADVLLLGPAMPLIVEGIEKNFTLHKLFEAKDHDATIAELGPRVQADGGRRRRSCRHQGRLAVEIAEARDHFELRRRLRPHRRQMGGATWRHRHQHARRARRRSRRHRARPLAHDRARIAAIRALSARRQVDRRRLSADARNVARPHRGHCRHGPHRQGDRQARRGVRRAGGLSLAQSAEGRLLQALSATSSPWRRTSIR